MIINKHKDLQNNTREQLLEKIQYAIDWFEWEDYFKPDKFMKAMDDLGNQQLVEIVLHFLSTVDYTFKEVRQ